jgi:hypothetical protein
VIAYKFLRPGRIGPFSSAEWPPPGIWLESVVIEACWLGVHACRIGDLPFWIGIGELWEIELDGRIEAGEHKLVAPRGRLVRRVEEWNVATADAFRAACAAEARRRAQRNPDVNGVASDVALTRSASRAAFMGARTAELDEGPSGYDAERLRQAEWLAETLQLSR